MAGRGENGGGAGYKQGSVAWRGMAASLAVAMNRGHPYSIFRVDRSPRYPTGHRSSILSHRSIVSAALALALCSSCFTPVFTAPVMAAVDLPEKTMISRTSPSGNYLAGRFANANRDMGAAAIYYRAGASRRSEK